MKKNISLVIILLLIFNSCKGQNEKDTEICNNESKVIQILSKLDEVKEAQNYIDIITNHKRGLSYLLENEIVEKKDCFRIKVGFNGKDHLETYYIFYVNKKNCADIYIDETVSGDIITIAKWRSLKVKNNIKVNKNMKTKQEYFAVLFNESSTIEFTPEQINQDKPEIIEFKRKLKLFDDLNPDSNDFNFDNLRILINNEVFTNSENIINSSWLEYFVKKYNIDVKKLTGLFDLAIIQEDFDALKILLKYGYICSSKELNIIDDRMKYFKSLHGKIDLDEYYDPSYSKIELIQKFVLNKFKSNRIKDTDGYTNLRKGKGTNFDVIEKINTYTKIEVLDNIGDWYLVKTKSGVEGYIHKSKIVSE